MNFRGNAMRYLRLAEAPREVQEAVELGLLTFGLGARVGVLLPIWQEKVVAAIEGLTARAEVEKAVREILGAEEPTLDDLTIGQLLAIFCKLLSQGLNGLDDRVHEAAPDQVAYRAALLRRGQRVIDALIDIIESDKKRPDAVSGEQ